MPEASAGQFLNAADHPAETLRLVAGYHDALAAAGRFWADPVAESIRTRIREGRFLGVLWMGPGDEAVALAGWDVSGQVGRRGWIYLVPGYQTRPVLERLVDQLGATPGLPFVQWDDDVLGVPQPDREAIFQARGFTVTTRADMRLPETVTIPARAPDPSYPIRPLSVDDEPKIADLMCRVYHGEPERALFATSFDEHVDAVEGTHGILHGDVGRWLPEASFGIEHEGRLVAHTLANELMGGLISEVGVDAEYRRRGFARQLLARTIPSLRSLGFAVPRLVVTMWNPRAVALYQGLGFVFVPEGSGRVWLDLGRFGKSLAAG